MLEFIAPDLPNRSSRRAGPSKTSKEGWLARLARRLLIRMEVGSSQRPATLYLSSVDLMPMGTWGGGVRRRPGQPENRLPPGDLIGLERVGPPVTGEPSTGGLCS